MATEKKAKLDDTVEASDSSTNNANSNDVKTIREGSVVMQYPADQESAVFYNPVQVQNRDLSILMITLYGERRAAQITSRKYQHSLKQLETHQGAEENTDSATGGEVEAEPSSNADDTDLKRKVAAFEANLNPTQAVQDLHQEDTSNGLCILDALAASGLRSLRYWNEIPGVYHVTINDMDPAAIERAQTNVVANQLESVQIQKDDSIDNKCSPTTNAGRRPWGICLQTGDATTEMYNSRPTKKLRPGFVAEDRSWDVIDLDPYGSAVPFLDAAIQGIANGGLIACTCTDMAALGGSRPHTCVGRYGSMPIPKASYLHEMALRILLHSMAVTASKYGRTIHPVLSVGMDFYVRVFVTVHDSKAEVNDLSAQLGYVFQSTRCQSFEIVRMGEKKYTAYQPGRVPGASLLESDTNYKIGGPMWMGPLHDAKIIKSALDRLSAKQQDDSFSKQLSTKERLRGLLLSCRDELPDVPLFYQMPHIARTLHLATPPMQMVRNALLNAGYRVSAYHKEPLAVKTDAPNQVVWDVMRAWYEQQKERYPKTTRIPKSGSMEEKILTKPIETNIDFKKPSGAANSGATDEEHVARFPRNPKAYWGPKKATTGYKRKAEVQEPSSND